MRKMGKSIKDALRGLTLGFASGRNMLIALAAMVAVLVTGVMLNFAACHWVAVVICYIAVISLELFNTAIEKLCDLVEPNLNSKIRYVKDMTAGAVLWACIGALAIFIIILGDVL